MVLPLWSSKPRKEPLEHHAPVRRRGSKRGEDAGGLNSKGEGNVSNFFLVPKTKIANVRLNTERAFVSNAV